MTALHVQEPVNGHNGRFDIATGKAIKLPIYEDLKTYPAEQRGDKVFINLPY